MQGVQARYGAELPSFISIFRYAGRPIMLGMDHVRNFSARNSGVGNGCANFMGAWDFWLFL